MTIKQTPQSKPRILIVEDEYLISAELQQVLEDMGCVVIGPVPTVAEAVVVSRTVAIDAAILDVVLRGEEAYAVADALTAHRVPFGFATGMSFDLGDVWRDRPLITKPYMSDDVLRLLRGLLPHAVFAGARSEEARDGR